MRVLIIEDNYSTAQVIELALSSEGIICDRAELGEDGLQVSRLFEYDLIILDIMLPDIDGYEVLERIRKAKSKVPILLLSGLDDSEKKIRGLGGGADDCLTKPFNNRELVARVKAIIRRSKGHSESTIEVSDLVINLDKHSSHLATQDLHLTTKEQSILELMALRKGQIVTKDQFLTHLYNGIDEPELKIIDVFVCRLRKKIYEASKGINYIETIWGRGYSLKKPEEVPVSQRKVGELITQ